MGTSYTWSVCWTDNGPSSSAILTKHVYYGGSPANPVPILSGTTEERYRTGSYMLDQLRSTTQRFSVIYSFVRTPRRIGARSLRILALDTTTSPDTVLYSRSLHSGLAYENGAIARDEDFESITTASYAVLQGLTREIDHRRGRGRGERVGEGPGVEAKLVDIVEEGGGRAGEAHAAEFRDDVVGRTETLRAQPAAHPTRLVDHRPKAELHQFVGRHHAGDAGADDRDLVAEIGVGHGHQAVRVIEPGGVVEGEVGAEAGDRLGGRRHGSDANRPTLRP